MACGIKFYRAEQNIASLKDSEETEQFTLMINAMFDALNRKYPKEGIRINSSDFVVCFSIKYLFLIILNINYY